MCSIIGSYSQSKIEELANLNSYRGQHSHSIFVFDYGVLRYRHKQLGALDLGMHSLPNGYIVVHQQAPTTDGKDINSVHPAEINDHLLWHNGIIKTGEINRLREELRDDSKWDTKLLLNHLIRYENVNDIDGTFSCLWYNGKRLFLFRNEISPMFYDNDGNISSTKFNDSKSLEPNKIWLFEPSNSRFDRSIASFETVENPYYFVD